MVCNECGSEDTLDAIIGGEKGIKCNECGFYNVLTSDKGDLKNTFMEKVINVLNKEVDKDE